MRRLGQQSHHLILFYLKWREYNTKDTTIPPTPCISSLLRLDISQFAITPCSVRASARSPQGARIYHRYCDWIYRDLALSSGIDGRPRFTIDGQRAIFIA